MVEGWAAQATEEAVLAERVAQVGLEAAKEAVASAAVKDAVVVAWMGDPKEAHGAVVTAAGVVAEVEAEADAEVEPMVAQQATAD